MIRQDRLLTPRRSQSDAADSCCLIECVLGRDDCAPQLVEWGKRVAASNSRPPEKRAG